MNSLFNMFTLTDHVFPEQIWDLSTVNPEDLILTKPNPTSGSQEANIPSPHMDDFRCNYGSDVAIVKAIDIVSENMDASVDDMDIDNVLLQNFLYEPTLSADCSNPEEFEGDWTNPDLAFALFDEMMKDLDQHVRSEKPISDNPPDSVDMLDEVLVFSSSGDFASNKQLAEQADEQIGGLPNEQPCQHGNEQPREQLDEWPNKQPDESLDEQPNQHLESQSERQPDEPSKKQPNQHLDSQSNKQPDEHQDEQLREELNDQANEEDDWHFYVEDVKPWEQPCKNRGPGRSSANPIIIDDEVDYRTHEMQSTQHRRSSRTRRQLTTSDNDEMLRYSDQYDLAALVDNIASDWEQIQADWFDMSEIVRRYQYPEIKKFEKNLQEEVTDICLSQGFRHSPGIGKMLADLWKSFCIRLKGNDEISETAQSYAGLLDRFAKHEHILYLIEL